MKHEIVPSPGKKYRVNGYVMVVKAISSVPYYYNQIASTPFGRYVHAFREFANGKFAKRETIYLNGNGENSWYDQDVVEI